MCKCYWCGAKATSKEHVPPKCLFPENKDINKIYNESFRRNLITVPSCDRHNLEKSKDDQYLMACLTSRVGNNGLAYIHTRTKVARAVTRDKSILPNGISKTLKINDSEFPVNIIEIDTYRLANALEAIARGLYYHERKSSFTGECMIISNLFSYSDNEFISRSIKLIEEEKPNWHTEVKGDNKKIFTYQFSPEDGFKSQTLKLIFFEKTIIYVIMAYKKNFDKQKDILTLLNRALLGK